ncbi:MAG: S-layer homology domain-containing protein [Trueperaceae bacterium]
MKKLLITLLAALFASGAFAQTPFPDIPDNHWAGDAVADITALGIVIGFPDGTFRGNEAFTRYQAALVVSRLLDVVNEDLDARMALSEEDQASLRNALQELASDVAAQGVQLSSVESDVASLSDDVNNNAGRLDELESMLQGIGETDPDVVRDLLNQLASQRVAVDTAQAQAEAAEALANDAIDAANAAASRARENAAAIAALNSVVQGLGNRITALESAAGQDVDAPAGPGVPAGLTDRLSRNEADIANIREFVILLRRDQVALRDRVSALEDSDASQSAQLSTLDERVTALEENPLGLSGSISVDYRVERIVGDAFDIDRAYGLNNPRDMGASVFSTGDADLNNDDDTTDVGEVAQDRADIDGTDTPVTASLDLSADFGNVFDAAGSPSALNQFSAAVSIDLTRGHVCSNEDCTPAGTFAAYVFTVDEFTVTFDPIGGDPLTFTYGEEVFVEFTPYVFGLDEDPGFVATVGSPDFLAFLDPTLTVAHTGQDTDADDQLDYFKSGIRLTMSPFEGLTLGASYAQAADNAGDLNDVNNDNVDTMVYGVDGALSLSIFDLNFEYAMGNTEDPGVIPGNAAVLFVELGVDASGLPLIDELSANYRDIAGNWDDYGLVDGNDPTYDYDQAGFMVAAGLGLFILDVDAYFDSYATGVPNADVTAFGVDVAADLFAGFALTGFYHQVSVNGQAVDSTESPVNGSENVVTADVERDDNNYDTGFGVGLVHPGTGENALIDGLNLAFEYRQMEADFSRSEISAEADMALALSILSLTPYVAYETSTDSDTDATSIDSNEIRVGTGVATAPLGVFFAPSLEAAVNYRAAGYSDAGSGAADFTATEMQWSVGLVLNQFLFDNSSLTAKYGAWTGTNVSGADNNEGTPAVAEGATNISAGDVDGTGTQAVSGYELIWNYSDLEVAYGVYNANEADSANTSSGQVFSIAYTVDF